MWEEAYIAHIEGERESVKYLNIQIGNNMKSLIIDRQNWETC